MADAVVVREFVATLGYRIDEAAQRRYMDSIQKAVDITKELGLGLIGLAAAITEAVQHSAHQAAQLNIQATNIGLGETAQKLDAISYAAKKVADVDPSRTVAAFAAFAEKIKETPGLLRQMQSYLEMWNLPTTGSESEQTTRFFQALAKHPQFLAPILGGPLGGAIPSDLRNALMRPGIGAALEEYNKGTAAIGLDVDKYAADANKLREVNVQLQRDFKNLEDKFSSELVPGMMRGEQFMHDQFMKHFPEIGAALDKLGQAFSSLPAPIQAVFTATSALATVLEKLGGSHLLEIILAWKLLRGGGAVAAAGEAVAGGAAAVAGGAAAAGGIGLAGTVGLTALLTAVTAAAGYGVYKYIEGQHAANPNNSFWSADSQGRRDHERLLSGGGGGAPPQGAQKQSWWGMLWSSLIGEAHAEELPQNVKFLSDNVSDLNDTLTRYLIQQGIDPNAPLSNIVNQATGGASGGGHGAKINWNDPKVRQAIQYFMGQGHSMIAAIGIVSNLAAESGLDETIFNSSGHGGLAQWDQTRQRNFQQVMGRPLRGSTYEQQLQFVEWELRNSESRAGAAVDASGSVAESARAIYQLYERPGASDASFGRRVAIGQGLQSGFLSSNNYNSSADKNVTVTNTVTNNVSGATDAAATARQLKEVQDKQHSDLIYMFNSAVR